MNREKSIVAIILIITLIFGSFYFLNFNDQSENIAGDAIGRFAQQRGSRLIIETDNIVIQNTLTTNIDSDGDGLTDNYEEEIGSNPNLVDTDSDGINDNEEDEEYGTDPTNSDSDNDGFSDYNELFEENTNPLDQNDHLELIITISSNNKIIAYRSDDGSEYWRNINNQINVIDPETLISENGIVVFASNDASDSSTGTEYDCKYGLNIEDGTQIWKNCDSSYNGHLTYLESTNYIYEANGHYINAYDIQTGIEVTDVYLGTYTVIGNRYQETFFADEDSDRVYVLTNTGEMLYYDSSLTTGNSYSTTTLDTNTGNYVLGDSYTMFYPQENSWRTSSPRSTIATVEDEDYCTRASQMYASAALESDSTVFLGFKGGTYCSNVIQAYQVTSSGESLLWEIVSTDHSTDIGQTFSVGDKFVTDGNYLYNEWPVMAIDMNDGSIAWSIDTTNMYSDLSYDGNIEYHNGNLYHLLRENSRYKVAKIDTSSGEIDSWIGNSVSAFRIY